MAGDRLQIKGKASNKPLEFYRSWKIYAKWGEDIFFKRIKETGLNYLYLCYTLLHFNKQNIKICCIFSLVCRKMPSEMRGCLRSARLCRRTLLFQLSSKWSHQYNECKEAYRQYRNTISSLMCHHPLGKRCLRNPSFFFAFFFCML